VDENSLFPAAEEMRGQAAYRKAELEPEESHRAQEAT